MIAASEFDKGTDRALGATLLFDSCRFTVWAPNVHELELRIVSPVERVIQMDKIEDGYFEKVVNDAAPGTRYFYRLNGKDLPDPASFYQPQAVHGPSEICDPTFSWTDEGWRGIPLRDLVIYELHVGTFTSDRTFDGVISRLPDLKAIGVTAIELMPVSQFPGSRNWGYDGVGLFAVQNSYGGPTGLKRLVDAAHNIGIAVILDVVYNHFGPEGNYLSFFGPYFTDRFQTPWGPALNFDGPYSDHVRRFFIENALYWQTEFRLDGLRLDAVHAIIDNSAFPFLRELRETVQRQAEVLGRRFHLIAESDMNAPRLIRSALLGGYGLDAQWSDDFHHCLHVLLTGERQGYYMDYAGGIAQFAKVWREGYAYTGEYSVFRARRFGDFPAGSSLKQFVVCSQNHDQVGNRGAGERLSALTDFESLKLAAASVLLSPFTPLLFMGEEYGEQAPFQYFVDHSDPALIEAVRAGRQSEFAAFHQQGECPDPASENTFRASTLTYSRAGKGQHKRLREFYRRLISLRKEYPCFTHAEREHIRIELFERQTTMLVHYRLPNSPEMLLILTFAEAPVEISIKPHGCVWDILLDSALDETVDLPRSQSLNSLKISPRSALLLRKQNSQVR
jgi:maltooligosyltrehalose trehalohydrolase